METTSNTATADSVKIQADTQGRNDVLGDFVGLVIYEFDVLKGGLLTIELTNMTDRSIGGHLTGFVFNIDSTDADARALLVKTNFAAFLDNPLEHASQFGTYDAGAALGAELSGRGNSSGGIGVFQKGVFQFHIEAADAAGLTALSFVSGPAAHDFVVRFQGLSGGATDTVPIQGLPAPAAISLFAGVGLMSSSRRRSR